MLYTHSTRQDRQSSGISPDPGKKQAELGKIGLSTPGSGMLHMDSSLHAWEKASKNINSFIKIYKRAHYLFDTGSGQPDLVFMLAQKKHAMCEKMPLYAWAFKFL
jgi:hypothetical protein